MREKIILEVMDYIRLIALVVLVTTLMNTLLFTFSTVQQTSMEHTLHEGDVLVIEKVSYLLDDPDSGDIIVFVEDEAVSSNYFKRLQVLFGDVIGKFTHTSLRTRLVKRVIGVPGDVIDIHDGDVYVNGELLDEPYVTDLTFERVEEYPLVVEEGYYFVMGDNRDVSKDSRHFGTIPKENIEGKAIIRLLPVGGFGLLD